VLSNSRAVPGPDFFVTLDVISFWANVPISRLQAMLTPANGFVLNVEYAMDNRPFILVRVGDNLRRWRNIAGIVLTVAGFRYACAFGCKPHFLSSLSCVCFPIHRKLLCMQPGDAGAAYRHVIENFLIPQFKQQAEYTHWHRQHGHDIAEAERNKNIAKASWAMLKTKVGLYNSLTSGKQFK